LGHHTAGARAINSKDWAAFAMGPKLQHLKQHFQFLIVAQLPFFIFLLDKPFLASI